ncbi:MAG TPA: acylphosphatase [Candidatus Omnitrophica bacterium]|nr:acylphosphatase [Candidatus Omnitrophota bacterium]
MLKRVHVFYSGRVQGVGFRFTTERIALEMGDVYGWVRNLPDGRVEVVAEGEEERLNEFLRRIREGLLKRYIKREDVIWENYKGEFDDFEIRFY